jgi:hypothetical protein
LSIANDDFFARSDLLEVLGEPVSELGDVRATHGAYARLGLAEAALCLIATFASSFRPRARSTLRIAPATFAGTLARFFEEAQ